MGHDRRTTLARFLVAEPFADGATISLGREAAHHIRVLRVDSGSHVELTNGCGSIGAGTLVNVTRSAASVEVSDVRRVSRPPQIHMLVPVADRERMLWLAEKCTELEAASWRPVLWRRSASVSPRGAGPAFDARLKGRMVSALTQSGGAWLPEIHEAVPLPAAIRAAPGGVRIVLDPGGSPLLHPGAFTFGDPLSIALGPEGGIEEAELRQLCEAGFVRASLGDTILRFETAGIAALAVVRAALAGSRPVPLGTIPGSERTDGQ